MKCAREIQVSENDCIQSCQGLYVTGYFQKQFDPTERELLLSKVREEDPEQFGQSPLC